MTSYFVAGASRGIGQELVVQLSALSDTSIVFAGIRTPEKAPTEFRSNPKIRILKLDVTNDEDVSAAAESIKQAQGSLDIMIINAGAANNKLLQASVEELREALELNTVSTHRLMLATLPLVKVGRGKKIIAIGTGGGSFGLAQPFAKEKLPIGIYGVSKAALHFLVMLYGVELSSQGILTASVHPGVVDTEGVKGVFDAAGADTEEKFAKAGAVKISKKESVEGILSVVKNLTSAETGNLFAWDGTKLPF